MIVLLFGKLAFNMAALALAVCVGLAENLRVGTIFLHDNTAALTIRFRERDEALAESLVL